MHLGRRLSTRTRTRTRAGLTLTLSMIATLLVTVAPSGARPAEAATLVHEAYWDHPSYCVGYDGWDLPVTASTTMSNLNYSEGEVVRITVTVGSYPPKVTHTAEVNGETRYRYGGVRRVQAGWSGQTILDWGGPGTSYQSGTSVVFQPSTQSEGVNPYFGSGTTFWVEYEAPAAGTAYQLPGSYISSTLATSYDESEGQQNGGCFLIDPDAAAVCEVTQSGPGGSVVTLTDTTPGSTGRTWTFPDGTTSTEATVTRTATEPGPYSVDLAATGANGTGTTTCEADVEAPALTGSIRLVHDDETNTSGKFALDEEFTVRLRVGADDDGVGPLTSTIDVDGVFVAADELDVLSGPTPAIDGPVTLAPGETEEFEWRVAARRFGKFRVDGDATAVDASGDAVDPPLDVEANGRVGGQLDVDLSFDPEEVNLVENIDDGTPQPEPQEVRVTVTLTNPTDETASGVTLPDELVIVDTDNPITALARLANLSGPWPTPPASGPVDVGPFDMAPDETRTVDYLLEARDDGRFDVRAEIELSADGDVVFEVGTESYEIGAGALVGFELTNDLEGTFVRGGDSIRVSGFVENLSTTETVKIDLGTLEPELTGNATPIAIRELDATLTPTNCGWISPIIELAPGDRELVHGRLDAHPDGGTRATVSYPEVGGVVLRGGDASTPPTEVPLGADDVLVTSASTLDFDYSVDTSVELGEWSRTAFAYGLTIGFFEGTSEWIISGIEGIAAILREVTTWENWASVVEHGPDLLLKAAKWYYQNWAFRTGPEKALYVAELTQDFFDAMVAAGVALQDAEKQKALADAVLPGWFDQVEQAYATNDPFAIGQAMGRAGGTVAPELITCIPFKAKYAGQFQKIADAKKVENAAEVAKATRLAEAGAQSSQLQQIRRAIPNGSRVSANASIVWGVGQQAFDALSEYARKNNLLITLRDRSPGSIRRLAEGYVEKYEFMKLKNVRKDIDGPLGYLDEHADTVAFKKPLTQAELDDVLSGISDPTLKAEIASRNAKRTKEWDKWLDTYKSWETTGFPAGFKNKPNGGARADDNGRLPFRLAEVKRGDEVIPDYFVPEVFVGGKWRGFTGDLDIIDIRRIDGQALSPSQASKVYGDLNRMDDVNLRHGDTAHWISDPKLTPDEVFDIKLDQLADYFVGGSDRALQFAPDAARAVQLDASKSFVLKKPDGGVAGRTTYVTWEGGADHWIQDWTGYGLVEIDLTYSSANLPMFMAPADWVLNGCAVEMDRAEGSIIRQSETGPELELFENGAWSTLPADECVGVASQDPRNGATSASIDGSMSVRSQSLIGGGTVSVLPQTGVASGSAAGQVEIAVFDLPSIPSSGFVGDWFEVGDEVILDPGTEIEERRHLVAISPGDEPDTVLLAVDAPLESPHRRGAILTLAAPDLVDASSLHPITPARLVETRSGEVTVDGREEGIGRLEAGSITPVEIAGRGGVDAGAAAVALNVTAIRPSGAGYVTLFPCDEEQPLSSSLNYATGAVAGNSGIVKLDGDGELCVFTFAETDLVIDATGWLAEADDFSPLVSARLAETRAGQVTVDGEEQDLGRLAAASTTALMIAGRGGVDSDADAVALNVTAINPAAAGFVTLFPCDGEQPLTSSLNYAAGDVKGNSAVVSLSNAGELCVYSSAETDLVIDVNASLDASGSFAALVPGRVLETRAGQATVDGESAGVGRVGSGEVVEVDIAGRAEVGDGASAVAVNVTAIAPAVAGYVTLFPCDGDQPLTSSLNYGVGGVAGNSAIVKLAADGSLCAFSFADTDLVVDVTAAWVG